MSRRNDLSYGITKLRKEKLEPLNGSALNVMFTNADQLTPSMMVELKNQIIQIEKPLIVAVSEVKPKNSVDYSTMDYIIPGFEASRFIPRKSLISRRFRSIQTCPLKKHAC